MMISTCIVVVQAVKRFDFSFCLINLQEEEIKEKNAKIEYAEQRLTTLSLELKVSFETLFKCRKDNILVLVTLLFK